MKKFLLLLLSLFLAGLSIPAPAQSMTVGVNVRDLGAKGDGQHDDTKAMQSAIDQAAGRPIYLPAGKYLVTQTLSYHTSGYSPGLKIFGDGQLLTIIVVRLQGGPVFDIDGSGHKGQFQVGGYLRDFNIEGAPSKLPVDGIQLSAAWDYSIERLWIQNLSGDAIKIPLHANLDANPDQYATEGLSIRQSRIAFNGGWGIDAAIGIGAGNLTVEQCNIQGNKGGGIYSGAHDVRIISNAIGYNGAATQTGGLLVDYITAGGNGLIVENNEFDSNFAYHIWIKAQDTFRIVSNRMISSKNILVKDDQLHPATHVKLGGAGHAVRDFVISQNYHRSKSGFQFRANSAADEDPLQLYEVLDPSVIGTIERPWIPGPDNTKNITKVGGVPKSKVEYQDMKQ